VKFEKRTNYLRNSEPTSKKYIQPARAEVTDTMSDNSIECDEPGLERETQHLSSWADRFHFLGTVSIPNFLLTTGLTGGEPVDEIDEVDAVLVLESSFGWSLTFSCGRNTRIQNASFFFLNESGASSLQVKSGATQKVSGKTTGLTGSL
jgi:hypothetical protein